MSYLEFLSDGWHYSLAVIYYAVIAYVCTRILLDNKEPSKAMGYVLILIFVPIAGLLIYYLFGQNFRKEKLFNRKAVTDNDRVREWMSAELGKFPGSVEALKPEIGDHVKIARLLLKNDKAFLSAYNKLSLIENGENAFPEMLEAIRAAKHHVHMEYYILGYDEVGKKFLNELERKAKEGVEVRFIFDDVGSPDIKRRIARKLRKRNIQIYPFMPVRFPRFTSRINYRDHRKILIVDGHTAFIGGINLRRNYDNSIGQKLYWRDLNLRLEGEAVKSIQMLFSLNWYFVSDKKLPFDPCYFPQNKVRNKLPVQIAASGPDSDWASIMQTYFSCINNARKRVWLSTPYFIPNESITTALRTAALAGIDVQLMIPKNPDSLIAKAASFSFLGPLLEADVKVFIYTKGMLHAKFMLVDEQLSTIGSANIDQRSFEHNFEINAVIYDSGFNRKLAGVFGSDKKDCYQLTYEKWRNRPIIKQLAQSVVRLFAPVL